VASVIRQQERHTMNRLLATVDSGARTLVALDLPSARRVASLALEGNPTAMSQSPDGTRLVVFDRGPGEEGERGYKSTGKSS
jgi:hypothetical protein